MLFKWKSLDGPLQITITNNAKHIGDIVAFFAKLKVEKDAEDVYSMKTVVKDIVLGDDTNTDNEIVVEKAV